MFDIRTQLIRSGRDSIYRWVDKDFAFVAAVMGALIGVLVASLRAVVGDPVAGTKSVTLELVVTFNGASWLNVPFRLDSLTDEDERVLRDALADAMRPYRGSAVRIKA